MAASSPRCIQQTLLADNSHLVHPKTLNASPISTTTSPSSYNSELDRSSEILLQPKSDPHSASRSSSPHANSLKNIHNITIQLTQPIDEPTIVNPSSPVSSTNSTSLEQSVYASFSHRPWISALLATKFYGPCTKHSNLRKNDLNLFCTSHAVKICQYCSHSAHSLKSSSSPCTVLHVSRYMYHDVLLAKEVAALLDVSEVQSYLNNGNRVVYIDRRAQPKSKLAPHAKACEVCSRTLQDPFRFCSVFCRLAHAKDPAAVSTLPVPDASPLLHQAARKVKAPPQAPCSSHAKRSERAVKRIDRIVTQSPVTPSRSGLRSPSNLAPHLQLASMKKRNRRKDFPLRSPPLVLDSVYMFHDIDILV